MKEEIELVKCGKCESEAFTEIIMFAKVSAVMSQTGQAGIAPVGKTFICMNCGTPIEESDAVKELSDKSNLVLAK
jgi:DNA-directed RNA polymerase subunit RPC12/RpoP